MRKTLVRFKRMADRCRLVFAVLGIALASALLTIGGAAWYLDSTLAEQAARHDNEIAWLKADLDRERDITRETLRDLTEKVEYLIGRLDPMANTVQSAAETAQSAATTARGAAVKADGAATSAARATIRETVTPVDPAPTPSPESADQPPPAWLLNGG